MDKNWVHPMFRNSVTVKPTYKTKGVTEKIVARQDNIQMIEPMLAHKSDSLLQLRLYRDKNWIAERKLDGGRYLLYINDQGSRLFSRQASVLNGLPVERTKNVPHITNLKLTSYNGTVLDCEATAKVGDFGHFVSAMHTDGTNRIVLNVFDVPRYKGTDVTKKPLHERRQLVEEVVKAFDNPYIVVIEQVKDNKEEYFKQIVSEGGEGIILKNINSIYEPGRRSPNWVKVKKTQTYDVVVTGFNTTNSDKFAKEGLIGSVRFGVYKDGRLTEIGDTSGMSLAIRRDMSVNQKKYIGKVMEIKGQEILRNAIRHPSYLRMRPDSNAKLCTWDKLFKS